MTTGADPDSTHDAGEGSARTPTQRMLTILWMLRHSPDKTLQSYEIWGAIPEYQSGAKSGRRLYRFDIKSLTTRGLIHSGKSTGRIGNREAVVLRFLGKGSDLQLSSREHAALREARSVLGDLGPVPVTDGPRQRGGAALDVLTSAVRVLEEHGDDMTLAALASEIAHPPAEVLAALQQAAMLEVGPDHEIVLPQLNVEPDNDPDSYTEAVDDEAVSGALDPATADPHRVRVQVLRSMNPRQPLYGHGLDALGRFAYTSGETKERLGLIERALRDAPDSVDVVALREAEGKLRLWSGHLKRAGL